MNRRYVLATLVAVALFAGGWAVAQPGPPAAKPAEAPGRYAVTATPTGAVLVDTTTGQTWALRPGHDGPQGLTTPPAWEPIHRLDTKEEADKWKDAERRRKHALDGAKARK